VDPGPEESSVLLRILLVLLVVWLALSVLGAIIKGLFWLAVVGILFFLGTAAVAAVRRPRHGPPPRLTR
jgi:uncharacterized membrane protein